MSNSEMIFYIFDLEIFPNCFLFSGKFLGKPEVQTFEMSFRKNQRSELLSWLSYLQNSGAYLTGFNNIGFDYPILHELLNNIYTFDFNAAYQTCQQIIGSQRFGASNNSGISMRDRILPQVDLFKINHFDNANKKTSLKDLQFAMRSESVEDLPFPVGTVLTSEQIDTLIFYNIHDITETESFFHRCKHLIDMRKELLDTGVLTGDVLNFSDVKIGSEYLIKKIGRAKCFQGNKPRQTFRESIAFKDVILPKVSYRTEAFQAVVDWFKEQIIYTNSDAPRPKLESDLAGLHFHFGIGGVHASVENKKFVANETHDIIDIDVGSMYPSVAIANSFAPEHLGQDFVVAYAQLKKDRKQYKKGTALNATLKLAGNGAFGNSDNVYSCFYDPMFPRQITINGQLQLLQLVELLSLIPGLEIIQANTDGITAYVPKVVRHLFNLWKEDWEQTSGLELEQVEYSKMWIRDVNNYIALKPNGETKLKGAYFWPKEDKDYDGFWNKDYSMMVVQKVTELCLVNNWKPEDIIKGMSDPFDFMLRYKTPSGATVYLGDRAMSKTVRYYVSTKGEPMKKIATPKGEIGEYKRKAKLSDSEFDRVMSEIGKGVWDPRIHTKNKSKYEMTETSIEAGRLIKECNRASKFDWSDVDWDYYIQEVKKLIIGG